MAFFLHLLVWTIQADGHKQTNANKQTNKQSTRINMVLVCGRRERPHLDAAILDRQHTEQEKRPHALILSMEEIK